MAGSGSDNKTEKATDKKRRDERKKGHVFTSKDIVSVVSILIVFSVLKLIFPSVTSRLMFELKRYMDMMGTTDFITDSMLKDITINLIIAFCVVAMPLLLTSFAVGFLATGMQTKFNFSKENLQPKFSKLNPLSGLKRMVSLKSFVELIKNLIKVMVIGYLVYDFIVKRLQAVVKTLFTDINDSIIFLLDSVMSLVYSICIIFIFIAGIDYIYQKWEYEKSIRMSKHDIKEEYKQMEGDPQIKGKIKEKQRQISLSRMMQAVPTADVVIRNPEHFAVALRYDINKDNAPIVVAKGQDELALRIVRVAEANNIKAIENKLLARAIYATANINQEIPIEHYTAVAEILALVYKDKK